MPFPELGKDLPDPVRRAVADAWFFRWQIEVESELRFQALSKRLASAGFPKELVERAEVASADEHRHAAECADYVTAYGGGRALPPRPERAREFAPDWLDPAQRLTYEMTATCCIAETNSATNLVTLFNARPPEPVRSSLQILSKDEVTHGQLGWAYLEVARGRHRLDFLAPLLPDMLGTGERIFEAGPPEQEDPRLVEHGVLPHSQRRQLFVAALEEVVFPGFEQMGVSTADARTWLETARSAAR